MIMALTATGTVAFVNIDTPDNFMGTESYNITLGLEAESSEFLAKEGVKLREYEGVPQRKFTRKVEFGQPKVYDAEGNEIEPTAISWGDKVRVLYSMGKGNSLGRGVYLNKVKLLEKGESEEHEEVDSGDF